MRMAQRVIGDSNELTFNMNINYARALYEDPAATLENIREGVATLEETARTARRVLGPSNPLTIDLMRALLQSRAVLDARETPSPGAA